MKPEPAIFRLIIERYQLQPAATAFIDDSARNVEAARREGLQGIHFVNAEDLVARLRDVGVMLA